MRAEIITFTPDTAKKYLESNFVNRRVKKSKVTEYANAMRAGNWGLTGQTLIFDTEGHLINGQHRLLACVESGCEFKSLVVFDSDGDISMIDMGASRSTADILDIMSPSLRNGEVSKILEGAWYSLWQYGITGWITSTPTPYDRAKAILKNDRLLRIADENKVKYKARLVRPSNSLALSYIGEIAGENKEKIDRFIRKIRDGYGELLIENEPAVIYRSFMEDARDSKVVYQNPQQLKFAIKALAFDLDGRKLTKRDLSNALNDSPKPQLHGAPPEKIHESLGLK
jgi:hypothetical protein